MFIHLCARNLAALPANRFKKLPLEYIRDAVFTFNGKRWTLCSTARVCKYSLILSRTKPQDGINTGKSIASVFPVSRIVFLFPSQASVPLTDQHGVTVYTISLPPFFTKCDRSLACARYEGTYPVNVCAHLGDRRLRMCTLRTPIAKATGSVESDGVLFTRRVIKTRRSIESRPARASD